MKFNELVERVKALGAIDPIRVAAGIHGAIAIGGRDFDDVLGEYRRHNESLFGRPPKREAPKREAAPPTWTGGRDRDDRDYDRAYGRDRKRGRRDG